MNRVPVAAFNLSLLCCRHKLLHPLAKLSKPCLLNGKDRAIYRAALTEKIRAVEAVAEQVRLEVGGVARRKRSGDRCLAPGIA